MRLTWTAKALIASILVGGSANAAVSVRQILRPERLTLGNTNVGVMQPIDLAAWIWMPGCDQWGPSFLGKFDPAGEPVSVLRFRRLFSSAGEPLRLDVSADERFVLLLDGKVLSRGPHRGSVTRWYYQSYEVTGLAPGEHRLEAVCWQLGPHAPIAQLSWRGGFILKAEGPYDKSLTTGKAEWQVAPLQNSRFTDFGVSRAWGAGSQCEQTGTSFLNEEPAPGAWCRAQIVRAPIRDKKFNGIRQEGWKLFPTERLDQMSESKTPGRVVNAAFDLRKSFIVPAETELDLWWDLNDYYCAYPELETSGGKGAVITWGWTEALRDAADRKGDRNEWRGKNFSVALSDTFRPDGRADAIFTVPWWRCGRWCRLRFKTAEEPLTVRAVRIVETRYPLSVDARFESNDHTIGEIGRICRRAVETCAHETLFDCPYYEQQMYPGDSRIQLLVQSAISHDDRLARFAMTFFDSDRRSDGFVAMNYPTRAMQESATYTLCWTLMLRDYMMWRNDVSFLKARMPGVRNALMGIALYENGEGLLEDLPGWSFMDWVADWVRGDTRGVAPDGGLGEGAGSLNSLLYLLALRSAEELERALDEPHLAAHWRQKAERLGKCLVEKFWDGSRGLMADTDRKDRFSEHAQCLSLLADILSPEQAAASFRGLETGRGLAAASSYFAYYLFEAYAQAGRADLIRDRLEVWRDFVRHGARTAFEKQDIESRSDCHGWSACPLYFYQTAFAGVKPSAPFFKTVRIAPQPAGLRWIRAQTPCPAGMISEDLKFEGEQVSGAVILPAGMSGTFAWQGRETALTPGLNRISQ